MSYQVLARKWRPKSFEKMVGQEHVLQALINALDQQRLHHAYLFTGTRGVGKTTIARILAKCLNCEKGISSKPCDECYACQAIDAGRFIDLIEVDAASRTKVEDTRELLDNVQYAPTSGRYKVYLIDEVHMLSGHSFNALLKTLEEPPSHVIFLLATTDPQKLPITVLSRCLQFNLKCLSPDLISHHLIEILELEQISFEEPALKELAKAADGSVRDALSLLDQAIAFSNGVIKLADIHSMLGTLEDDHVIDILTALADHDIKSLLSISDKLAESAVDFQQALEAILSYLHKLAIFQATENDSDELATRFNKNDIQLFYQIALLGRRDLPLAPSQKIGFEMVLLRMLDFRPTSTIEKPTDLNIHSPNQSFIPPTIAPPESTSSTASDSPLTELTNELSNSANVSIEKITPAITTQAINWNHLVEQLSLTGMALALANNCELSSMDDRKIVLSLGKNHAALLNPTQQKRIETALQHHFNTPINLSIEINQLPEVNSPAKMQQQQREQEKQQAQNSLATDPAVTQLLESFKATIDNSTVQRITTED